MLVLFSLYFIIVSWFLHFLILASMSMSDSRVSCDQNHGTWTNKSCSPGYSETETPHLPSAHLQANVPGGKGRPTDSASGSCVPPNLVLCTALKKIHGTVPHSLVSIWTQKIQILTSMLSMFTLRIRKRYLFWKSVFPRSEVPIGTKS